MRTIHNAEINTTTSSLTSEICCTFFEANISSNTFTGIDSFGLSLNTSPHILNVSTPKGCDIDNIRYQNNSDDAKDDTIVAQHVNKRSASNCMKESNSMVEFPDLCSMNESIMNECNITGASGNDTTDAISILSKIRLKHTSNVIIGHLNINSLTNKFDALEYIIKGRIDVLVVGETKLNDNFPNQRFRINGYCNPYRLDRNVFGGGVMIYVRNDIPSKRLESHQFTKMLKLYL